MVAKREDYISWDEYFMGVAILAAKRSKDPNTQVGACIVDKNNVIDAVDASQILSYYAYSSTTKDEILSLEEFLQQANR